MTIYGAGARKLAKILGVLGALSLVICVLMTAFGSDLPQTAPEKPKAEAGTSATEGSPKKTAEPAASPDVSGDCRTALSSALESTAPPVPEIAAQDNVGTPRIIAVWPRTVRLGGQLCLVVAGIAPQASQDLLKKTLLEKTLAVPALAKQFEQSAQDAAKAKQEADALDAQAAADAKLKGDAEKKRAEQLAKEKKRDEDQKKWMDANVAAYDAAVALNRGLPPVDVALFLNERRSPLVVKANAVSGRQLLIYEFGQTADATSEDAKFWRGLLAGKTEMGLMRLSVGISKSQSSMPEVTFKDGLIGLRVYWPSIVGFGAASVALLVAAFVIFAANSTVLRDNDLTKVEKAKATLAEAKVALAATPADAVLQQKVTDATTALTAAEGEADAQQPIGTFSLGRTQMALWLGLSTAGFIFLWLTLGFYRNVITEAILVLLGISSVTGLAAMVIDRPDTAKPPPPKTESIGFLADLTSDGKGATLQRIQVIVWTCILAVIFIWNVISGFVFVNFDTNLLLLMGIASSTYLGFKTRETAPVK
jgi:hypothetical protein